MHIYITWRGRRGRRLDTTTAVYDAAAVVAYLPHR